MTKFCTINVEINTTEMWISSLELKSVLEIELRAWIRDGISELDLGLW